MQIDEFIHALPKSELHLHLEGAVAAPTVIALARSHDIAIPDFSRSSDLYAIDDLATFLRVYDIVCRCMRTPADFHRVTYETLARCAASNVRYVEMFFSPHAHHESGIRYGAMLDGILAGMRDAEKDLAVVSRLIPAHNRELGPEAGMEFLQMVLEDRRDEVIGIGLDYLEGPPAPYAPMYAAARKAGLRATAHAGETGPAANVRDSIELLGCDRIDHGYHVVDDAALVAACAASHVGFTVCPSTTRYTTVWRDLDAEDHAIRRMAAAGLEIVINTDDPGFFWTELDAEYRIAAQSFSFTPAQLAETVLAGLRMSWLDATTKAQWVSQWTREVEGLLAQLGPTPAV
jgi:adenosine deaminase